MLVSTIPSAFIIADKLVHQGPAAPTSVASASGGAGPGHSAAAADVPASAAATDGQSAATGSPDDCSEITSTVADEPSASAPAASPSSPSVSPPPPPDHGKQSGDITRLQREDGEKSAPVSVAAASTAELIGPVTTTSAFVTTTTAGQQSQAAAGRQKKSLEMVVNLLKRPSASTTVLASSVRFTASPSVAAVCAHQSPSTSSGTLPTSGHVVLNGSASSAGDDYSIGLSLLQRLIAAPSPVYSQPPLPAASHFRFRSVAGNGWLPPPAARSAQCGPPIKQLKHMCKNVRSFVPSGQARRQAAAPFDLLFGGLAPAAAVPVARHRPPVRHPPRAAGAATCRGACVRSQHNLARPRFHAPAAVAHLPTSGGGGGRASRDRKQCGDGAELSALMRVLLEASGNSCHPSTSCPSSSAELWKAAIN